MGLWVCSGAEWVCDGSVRVCDGFKELDRHQALGRQQRTPT